MMNSPETPVSKREVLSFLYKYQRQLLYAFLLPFILCGIISFIPTPRYKASSVLIIKLGTEYVYNPENGSSPNGESNLIPFDPSQIFKSEVAILNSEDLHAQTIQAIGIGNLFPRLVNPGLIASISNMLNNLFGAEPPQAEKDRILLARAVEQFDKRLNIELEKESAVIDISFENTDAQIAKTTLSTLLSLYFEKRKSVYTEPRLGLARTEMEAARGHALAAMQAVEQFKVKHSLHSLDEERMEFLKQRGKALEQAALINSAGLENRIASYNRELTRYDELERRFALLQQEEQIANTSYTLASHKYDEAKAYEDLEHEQLDSVRIVQQPSVPPEPHHLQWLIILGGTILSVFSLLSVAAVLRFLENGFRTPDQVEKLLGLTVLSTLHKPNSVPEETMRHLIHAISPGTQQKPAIITFISARDSEGTSDIAWNYASTLAKDSNKKVLLIDAGKLSSERYQPYQFTPKTGIVDTATGSRRIEEAVYTISDTLSVCRFISDEKHRSKISQIINAEDFWKDLSGIFGYIVIDASALQYSYDGIMLATKSEATVIVIEAEKTPQAAVKHLRDTLLTTGAKPVGAVINKYPHYIPERIYQSL